MHKDHESSVPRSNSKLIGATGEAAATLQETEAGGVREAVGVFDTAQALQNAIDELLSSGFHRAELSLLAKETEVVSKLGHKYRKSSELQDNHSVPRAAYVSTEAIGDGQGAFIGALVYVGAGLLMGPVAAAGGTLVGLAGAAILGGSAGGLVGSWLAKRLGDQHAQRIEEQLKHGGLLLWVRTWNAEKEGQATRILKQHSGQDVHVRDSRHTCSASRGH